MGLPHDETQHCLRYDGCSLSLLGAPNNSCNYPICYGKENTIECGTHKFNRLGGKERRVEFKEVKPPVTEPHRRPYKPRHEDIFIEDEELPLYGDDTTLEGDEEDDEPTDRVA